MYHYRSFSSRQFAEDQFFRRWIELGSTDVKLDHTWKTWLTANADKAEAVEEARNILLAVSGDQQFFPSSGTRLSLWNRIDETLNREEAGLHEIESGTDAQRADEISRGTSHRKLTGWYKWAAAAAIVVAVGATLYLAGDQEESIRISEQVADNAPDAIIRVAEADRHPVTIVLEDGSSVVLQAHSKLTYPDHFPNDVRQVTLSGEGFFEITRDKKRPFYVRTSHITTRVLGTSFSVRLYPDDNKATVRVKTGNVSVFRQHAGKSDSSEIVLSPSQQVVYNVSDEKMTKSSVNDLAPLAAVARYSFEFQDAPLRDVFDMIRTAYSVEVEYDEATFSNCLLNASLNDVPFEEKLRLICKTIGATYKVEGNQVRIFGKGC